MAGRQVLALKIQVRILVPEPSKFFRSDLLMETNRKTIIALGVVLALILNDFRRHESLHALGVQEGRRFFNPFTCVSRDGGFFGVIISIGVYGTWLTAEAIAFAVGVPSERLNIGAEPSCVREKRELNDDLPTAIARLGDHHART